MQTKQQITPRPDRKLPEGLDWRYDPEINEWVMVVRPVKPAPIRSADEYFSLDLNHLSQTVCPNVMRMDRATCDRVKHLFSLSNLKDEDVTEHCLDNGDVMLCLPISMEDMVILAEEDPGMIPMEWEDRLKKSIQDGRFAQDVRTDMEHDIMKHTGKSCADMMDHIFAENRQVISSFYDAESVDDLLSEAVWENLEQFSLLFKNAGPNGRISISHAFDHKIGTAIRHADDKLQGIDTNAMTAVFTKDNGAGSLGLRLTTACPCIDRTLCPDIRLSRCRTDLTQEMRNTRKYRQAGPLEQACLENMCDLSSARTCMARDRCTGDVCCVKSSTKKTNYFIEIQGQDHWLRAQKQDRSTGRYAPIVPESDLTPQMREAFRQKLPRLTATVDAILSRCSEIQDHELNL